MVRLGFGCSVHRNLLRLGALKHPPMPESKVEEVKKALNEGNGIRETARLTGASTTTVMRIARSSA